MRPLLTLLLLMAVSFPLDSTDHNALSVLAPNPYIAFFMHPIADCIGEGSYTGKEYVQIGGVFAQAAKASDDDLVKMVAGNVADVIDKMVWKGFLHSTGLAIQLTGPQTLALNVASITYVVGRNFKAW